MSILFDEKIMKGNSASARPMKAQFDEMWANRKNNDPKFNQLVANAGRKPADLYLEWDNQTIPEFRLDEGDNILNPLMELSRSINIGRTVLGDTRASDAGVFVQSMSGEHGTVYDNVDYNTDRYIVPVSTNGFKRSWREGEQLSLEAFDDMTNQQREGVRTHRQGLIGSFMDGHKDQDGNFIQEDGVSWEGVRNDGRVDQIDLGAGGLNVDFTSPALAGPEFKAAWIALTQQRYINQRVTVPATFYVSNEIWFNMQRDYYDGNYANGKIIDILKTVAGVADIVNSSVLTGNQVLSIPMQTTYIQPIVGMAVSTIAVPRLKWNSPMEFEIVSAVGWQIKTDFGNRKAIQYASS